ncbi:MAG: SWIM zinc finger domain-containing protein [Prevotellaceae bacterium]|jgi:hypothetical protein|nr:SWIM zinc finger domain-containing protein [Prevotellaceae bacterium]
MNITQKTIEELATNAKAAQNGRDLVGKNKFSNLRISADKTLIWGECAGSGKAPYLCSADYVDECNPMLRCNCPSMQRPCKHVLGLLYAYEKGNVFTTAEISEDIISKRGKIEQRQQKKNQEKEQIREKTVSPKAVNKNTLVKKIDAQLSGIEIADKIMKNIVQQGLSSIDAKVFQTLREQSKELGNYYIAGIQNAFNNLWLELENVKNEEYTAVIDQINYISALLRKSTEYLQKRRENPDMPPEISSAIEEQTGTVWKLTELMQLGLWEENAEILQLSFNCYDNQARREYVDEGVWLNLKSGKIYKTKNYRPYRAAKYIKSDNSEFNILQIKELFIYPGDINPRIRWENGTEKSRRPDRNDLEKIQTFAAENYAETVKTVKNSIKNPLTDKRPVILLSLHSSYIAGDHSVIKDRHGNKLTVCDMEKSEVSAETQLKSILPADARGLSLLAMVNNDVKTGLFSVYPLSLITSEKIIRLLY